MEHWEINHKWIDFSRNDISRDHLISTGISNLAKVKVRGQYVCLDLVICNLTRVQLHNEVLFKSSHGIVLLQVREYLL